MISDNGLFFFLVYVYLAVMIFIQAIVQQNWRIIVTVPDINKNVKTFKHVYHSRKKMIVNLIN